MFLSAIQSANAKKTYVEMLHSGKKLHLCKMVLKNPGLYSTFGEIG
jgi:hypothetical protein